MLSLLPQFSDRVDIRFLGKTDDRTIPDPHVRLHQVHGNRVIVVRKAMESEERADGVITDHVGLHLTARAADCQNFAVYAPDSHVAGVLHVGWRGLIAGAIPEFFAALKREFNIAAEDTYVATGPSLCLRCAEFKDPTHEVRVHADAIYVHGDCVDLAMMANDQLIAAGVHPDWTTRHPDCTRCMPERYFTYRGGDRELVASGVSNILVCTLR